jgi:RNA polymerase sigma-70 factor (ECF subfamily)
MRGDEDTAQTALLRALERAPEELHNPRAYLARVARNVAIDEARRVRARGGPALAVDDLAEAHQPWSAPDQETAVLLKQVILALPPLYRDVFILNRFVGLTYGEIARRLGVSDKTVEYRMSRALALCQEALRD